jgi:hypothetical protein
LLKAPVAGLKRWVCPRKIGPGSARAEHPQNARSRLIGGSSKDARGHQFGVPAWESTYLELPHCSSLRSRIV